MSLEQELVTEKVSHLGLNRYCEVTTAATVRDTVAKMRSEKVNVCLITADDHLQGVFTDRDVLLRVVTEPAVLERSIETVMTANPIVVAPQASAREALWLMDEHGFRNLPVVDEHGRIQGNMTHQAIINFLAARYAIDVLNRPPRPDQFPRKQEGGD